MNNKSLSSCLTLLLFASVGPAQPSAFTYQGRLMDQGIPANGLYDIAFTLYDAPTNGSVVGTPMTLSPVAVSNGLFTVTLDFGAAAFPGADRWLEIAVNLFGTAMPPVILQPRQRITSSPYAIRAASSGTAATASSVAAGAVGTAALQIGSVDSSRIADGSVVSADLNPVLLTQTFWRLDGNSGTTAGAQFLGTKDNQPLEIKVNGQRGFRLEAGGHGSVNVIGGWVGNSIAPGVAAATIGGGGAGDWFGSAFTNHVEANGGTIGGGEGNMIRVDSDDATIGGGLGNRIRQFSWDATISGGAENTIGDVCLHSTISGGSGNSIEGSQSATIGGGGGNAVQLFADYGTIGGGTGNTIASNSLAAAIAGGQGNTVQTNTRYATISGGEWNSIQSGVSDATIGGGGDNVIAAANATIGGGAYNTIEGSGGSIAGGSSNGIQTNAFQATIGGGVNNLIAVRSAYATIVGGRGNSIGTNSFYSAIGGGNSNQVAPNGTFATIAGGQANAATNYAFAAGRRAKANHTGAFVWADSTDADIASAATNSVTLRASGGYRLFSDAAATIGVSLAPGDGSWTTLSDRNAKENFAEISPQEVLNKVAALPLLTWNYKSQDAAIRHLGPMAQDFKAAFRLGASDTGIATVDADGVALAAIQGLNQRLVEESQRKDAEIADLKQRLEKLEQLEPLSKPRSRRRQSAETSANGADSRPRLQGLERASLVKAMTGNRP